MSAITQLNPKAEVARAAVALQMNTTAARGLHDVLKTNLGPKGTMKMYALAGLPLRTRRIVMLCLAGWCPVPGTSR
jgi:hypothetical protein